MKIIYVRLSFLLVCFLALMSGREYKPCINLINENTLEYKEFKICDKLNKKYFKANPKFDYNKSRYLKPNYGTKISETFYCEREGLHYGYDDGVLLRIRIYFPCQDTTLRGIHVGCTKEEVVKAYGAVKATCGSDCISYGNLDFMLCNDVVYGIELWGDADCESE